MYFTKNDFINKDLGTNLYYICTIVLFILIVHVINFVNRKIITYNVELSNTKFSVFLILIVWIIQTLFFIPINHYLSKVIYSFNWFHFWVAIFFAPIFEEIIFRNILLNSLLNKYNIKKSVIISSCLFGFIHGNILHIIFSTIMGMFFGIIYVKNKNIAYTIILHFCSNMFVFIINFLVYKFSGTLLFSVCVILNIIISFLLLQNLIKKNNFSILKSIKQIQN